MYVATLSIDNTETGTLTFSTEVYNSSDYNRKTVLAYYSATSRSELRSKLFAHGNISNIAKI